LFLPRPSALIPSCCGFNQNLHLGNALEDNFVAFRRKLMSSNIAEIAIEAPLTSNPLDVIPDEIPFDVPYGPPISLDQAQAVIQAAVAEAKKRNWKMNVAVADSGGNLVAFQRMDGAMLASIQIAEHKARAAVTFRRPTKVFEDGIQLMHLNYLLAFDGVIASRGGIPLIDLGEIIGAIGCSGGTDSQDEVVSKAGAAVINKLPAMIK
jgi:glc operon protein GlcG